MPERLTFDSVATPNAFVVVQARLRPQTVEPLTVKLIILPLTGEPPEPSVAVKVAVPPKTPLPATLAIEDAAGGGGGGRGAGIVIRFGDFFSVLCLSGLALLGSRGKLMRLN